MVGGLAFLVLMSASYEARAQGRGRGESNEDKKCSKFVNCHDASEGRWDGRGPRRGTDSDNWNSRHFRHDRDSRFTDQRRRHHRDREFNRKITGAITIGTWAVKEPGVVAAVKR